MRPPAILKASRDDWDGQRVTTTDTRGLVPGGGLESVWLAALLSIGGAC